MLAKDDIVTFLGTRNERHTGTVACVDGDVCCVIVPELRMAYEVWVNQIAADEKMNLVFSYDTKRSFDKITNPTFLKSDSFMQGIDEKKREEMQKIVRTYVLLTPQS